MERICNAVQDTGTEQDSAQTARKSSGALRILDRTLRKGLQLLEALRRSQVELSAGCSGQRVQVLTECL